MKKIGLSLLIISFMVLMISGISFATEVDDGLIVQWLFDGELPEEVEGYGDIDFVEGQVGEAVHFDGNSYLEVDSSVDFHPESLTLSFWWNATEIPEGEVVFVWAKEDTDYGGDGWYLNSWEGGEDENASFTLNTDVLYGVVLDEPEVLQQRDIFFSPGEWVHFAITIDHDALEGAIYRNGMKMSTEVAEDSSITPVDSPAWIGFNSPGFDAGYIHGAMDDFRLYDRALSEEEIQQIMEEGQ